MRHGSLEFRVVAELPVLRIERTGMPDPWQLKAHCFAIVEEALRRGARRLLVDERGMGGWMPPGLDTLLVYREMVREAQAAGLTDVPMRIAVLTMPQNADDLHFLAQGAIGVGLDMAYFEAEEDALAWLGIQP